MNTFILVLVFSATAFTLQCWNCVGADCDEYSSSSRNWELVTCARGSVCQKTDFVFYSNQKNESRRMHTVRSCSYETGCTWDRSKNCQKSPILYAGSGCADRFCCAKDQCNNTEKSKWSLSLIVFLIILWS